MYENAVRNFGFVIKMKITEAKKTKNTFVLGHINHNQEIFLQLGISYFPTVSFHTKSAFWSQK